MNTRVFVTIGVLTVLMYAVLAAGYFVCQDPIAAENVGKIETGMTEAEVEAFMGRGLLCERQVPEEYQKIWYGRSITLRVGFSEEGTVGYAVVCPSERGWTRKLCDWLGLDNEYDKLTDSDR